MARRSSEWLEWFRELGRGLFAPIKQGIMTDSTGYDQPLNRVSSAT
jgi:hypothetical protein